MNLDGRLAEYKQRLQEQIKAREQAQANIFFIQGAIESLTLLKQDELKEPIKLEGEIVQTKE